MLIAGNEYGVPRSDQGFDGQVQGVGGVEGEDHLFRVVYVEEFGCLLAAGKDRFGGLHGRPVSPAAGAGQMVHSVRSRPHDSRRLLQGCSGTVQINHSSTSL